MTAPDVTAPDMTDGHDEFQVGELARRTGLTVRTLHHWDAIGLLEPARRTRAGYRLYGPKEVERLQRIVSLRDLGLGLDEIADVLDGPEGTLEEVARRHLARTEARIDSERRLAARLTALLASLERAEAPSVEELLTTTREITMFEREIERHYTPEQLETLGKRAEALGEERIEAVQREWPELIAKMRAAMEAGTDPSDPEVRALAARWAELVRAFTGGDPGIEASLRSLYREEAGVREGTGVDADLVAYVARAGG